MLGMLNTGKVNVVFALIQPVAVLLTLTIKSYVLGALTGILMFIWDDGSAVNGTDMKFGIEFGWPATILYRFGLPEVAEYERLNNVELGKILITGFNEIVGKLFTIPLANTI
jgi:hypothetical protein